MAGAGDVTIEDGAGNVKLHPYVVALVRWCVSCVWSAATVLLHRLMLAPLPAITASRTSRASKPRPAGSDHLHPEPRVECVVLHQPTHHQLDVIFVHGLYGSLGNTWRQGEWKARYKMSPRKVPLMRSTSTPTACKTDQNPYKGLDFRNIDENFYKSLEKMIPENSELFTENFYNNTLINRIEIIDNYDTQARFVEDMFKNSILRDNVQEMREYTEIDVNDKDEVIERCFDRNKFVDRIESKKESIETEMNVNKHREMTNEHYVNGNDNYNTETELNEMKKQIDKFNCNNQHKETNVEQHTNNTEIETNEKNKQMEYLNEIDINYNDYTETTMFEQTNVKESNENESKFNETGENEACMCKRQCDVGCGCVCDDCYSPCWPKDWIKEDYPGARVISVNYTSDPHLWRPLWVKESKRLKLQERAEQMMDQLLELGVGRRPIVWVGHSKGGLFIKQIYCEGYAAISSGGPRAALWRGSAGFMFYSVPHRGSPLADIKAPLTARSVELLEIAKDCALVRSLQSRWLSACSAAAPLVRSVVETRRTLMSVLWLRIVSVDSADAGIGALCGVNVDHREICKPSGRACPLYQELKMLIRAALDRQRCL